MLGTETARPLDDRPRPLALADLPAQERNRILVAAAESGHYDFIDLGTHRGGGLRFGCLLGGQLGLGVEYSEEKATELLRQGHHVYTGDIALFPHARARFRFAVCRHVLMCLPNRYVVGTVLWKLRQMCSEFLFIDQPNFDTEPYLRELGLVAVHSTLPPIASPMTTSELTIMLDDLGLDRYVLGGSKPMLDSHDEWVHPIAAEPYRWKWDPDVDPPKPDVAFHETLYRNFILVAGIDPCVDPQRIANYVEDFRLWRRQV
jgi:hypothetical protein